MSIGVGPLRHSRQPFGITATASAHSAQKRECPQVCPSFSSPVFSRPIVFFVRHFQVVHFQRHRQGICNGRASVRLSVRRCCGGFAAERPVGKTDRSTAAGAQQQLRRSTALSSKCGRCRVDRRVDEAGHCGPVLIVVESRNDVVNDCCGHPLLSYEGTGRVSSSIVTVAQHLPRHGHGASHRRRRR